MGFLLGKSFVVLVLWFCRFFGVRGVCGGIGCCVVFVGKL